jgi:hypothetical protein
VSFLYPAPSVPVHSEHDMHEGVTSSSLSEHFRTKFVPAMSEIRTKIRIDGIHCGFPWAYFVASL